MLNPILKIGVNQDQVEVLLQEPSSGLDSPIVQASLSVGFGKNLKGIDKNDIQRLQELSVYVLSVLSTMQAENEKSKVRLVARLQMENERTIDRMTCKIHEENKMF
jgi:hypothetical protein